MTVLKCLAEVRSEVVSRMSAAGIMRILAEVLSRMGADGNENFSSSAAKDECCR